MQSILRDSDASLVHTFRDERDNTAVMLAAKAGNSGCLCELLMASNTTALRVNQVHGTVSPSGTLPASGPPVLLDIAFSSLVISARLE